MFWTESRDYLTNVVRSSVETTAGSTLLRGEEMHAERSSKSSLVQEEDLLL